MKRARNATASKQRPRQMTSLVGKNGRVDAPVNNGEMITARRKKADNNGK